jgi:hypothetical protein
MAGSNGFQQWNPSKSNQLSDAAYTTNALRSGGAQVDDILPSNVWNKFAYDESVAVWAIMQMLANKGYSPSPDNPTTLTAVAANILTNADILPPMKQVAFSTALVFDCSVANGFQVTLTANVSSLTVKNAVFGQRIGLAFTQNSGGPWSVPFPSNVVSPGNVALIPANKRGIQYFTFLEDNKFHPDTVMTVS